jgi:hypothetical protein
MSLKKNMPEPTTRLTATKDANTTEYGMKINQKKELSVSVEWKCDALDFRFISRLLSTKKIFRDYILRTQSNFTKMPNKLKHVKNGYFVETPSGKFLSHHPLPLKTAIAQRVAVALSESRKSGKPVSSFFK